MPHHAVAVVPTAAPRSTPPSADASAEAPVRAARATDGGRHNSGATSRQIVRLVRHRAGDEGVRRLLEVAGEARPAAQLEDEATWSSFWQGKALFEAAAEVLDDADACRHVGEAMLGDYAGSAVAGLLRELGSPAEVLRHIAAAAAKYSTVVEMEPVEISDSQGRVRARSVPGFPRYRMLCDYTMGLLSQVPVVFGLPAAEVVEEACELRGDDTCVFRVRWDQMADGPEQRVRELEAQLSIVSGRIEALEATVGDLVSAEELDVVLARIAQRAGTAVRAPRFVLAVRPTDDGDLAVHHCGFADDAAAERAAARVIDGVAHDGSCLAVEVVSARHRYGLLAALHDGDERFLAEEHRLLAAYARVAAAALDAATALDEARHHGETARALLDLARALADAGTVRELTERLARTVPAVVACDRAAVWLWDDATQTLRLSAFEAPGGGEEARCIEQLLRGTTVTAERSPLLAEMLAHPVPRIIDQGTEDLVLRRLLVSACAEEVAVVPLGAGGELLGAVVAARSVPRGTSRSQRVVLERLVGLADHGATALQNARLMEQVHHQALHDTLTGLPNQRLLRDRVESALAHTRRTGTRFCLLFCDVDGFKPVNDLLGHATGDAVLRAVAGRLRSVLRDEDTVSRLGGDEFVVLLPGADDAAGEAVAAKLRAALGEPLAVEGGHRLVVSASIGVAEAPRDGGTYEMLLGQADGAMYQSKVERRR